MRIIAYAYDADHHCESCARKYIELNHPSVDPNDVLQGRIDNWDDFGDSEGNAIHPVFSTDEWYNIGEGNDTLSCTDCGGVLDTYEEDEE